MLYIDKAHFETDKEIERLERSAKRMFEVSRKEISKLASKYFEKYSDDDEKQRERLESGEITESQYKQWRLSNIARGNDFEILRDEIAKNMLAVNSSISKLIVASMLYTFLINFNQTVKKVNKKAELELEPLEDEEDVQDYADKNDTHMVFPEHDPEKDFLWNRKIFAAVVISGILLNKKLTGKDGIVNDAVRSTVRRNYSSARASIWSNSTNAETSARQEVYLSALDEGVKMEKVWRTMKDDIVRDAHAEMEGVAVPVDEDFDVAGYKMYGPGDKSAPIELWINCRCALDERKIE